MFEPLEPESHLDSKATNGSLTTVFLPIVYIFIFIVGLPTNAMALWVFLFRTKKKHPASILMANLALADLLFIVRCVNVQRYWAIVHPLSQKLSSRVTVCVCVCVWIVVWVLTVPLYLYDQTVKVTNLNTTTCHDVTFPNQTHFPVGYFLTMGIVGYVVPCVVCTVAYFLIFKSLRSSFTKTSGNKKKRKALILMVIALVMFLVCFTPSNITLMVHFSLLARGIENDTHGLYIITLCLSSLNSCLDPFVYYFISDDFRDHVKNTLMCHGARSAERMKVAFRPLKVSTESSS
uniref:Coagulation factor II (thrombin) receptor-like 1, tandem duplicate 1 n=1 Tax=Pygocentrus nattereri TaxID=42514 RepID=A0A3B4DEP6_PYGNA